MGGHLRNYSDFIDEEFLQQRHGGGKYELKVQKRDPSGKYQYFKTRTLTIAGDPRTDDIPRNVAQKGSAPASAAPQSEAPSVVTQAMNMMKETVEYERNKVAPAPQDQSGVVRAFEMTIQAMKDQAAARDKEMSEMRQTIATISNHKPEVDPFREKMLNNLLDGDTARMTQLRMQHESEIRMLKQAGMDDEKRLRDAFDRDRAAATSSHERELKTTESSHNIALSATKQSFETQIKILEAQIRMIERDNTELRVEVKELRAKKEKSLVEQVKEMEVIKEALGIDEDKESSTADKILSVVTDPDAIKAAREIIRGPNAAAAQQQAQPQQQQQPGQRFQRQIVTTPEGQKWSLEADGQLRKVKRKVAPGEIDLPEIAPENVAKAVALLEKAFTGGQEAEVVATSAKLLVPSEILNALRDVGPDLFMSKLAKLPASSPLANQAGRNWVRNVAKALTT